jgi:general stress protein YciG
MDRSKQREIASKGGKAAHQKGTAHEWTSEEAREAGRKGGIASHQRRRERMSNAPSDEVRGLGTTSRLPTQDASTKPAAEPDTSSVPGENPSNDQD